MVSQGSTRTVIMPDFCMIPKLILYNLICSNVESLGKLFSTNEFFESYNWILLYYTLHYLLKKSNKEKWYKNIFQNLLKSLSRLDNTTNLS